MAEDQLETPVSEENVASTATQEPTVDAPIPPSTSEQVEGPPENTGGPGEGDGVVPVTIDIPQPTPSEPILDKGDNSPPSDSSAQGFGSPMEATEGQGGKVGEGGTAQMAGNEPFDVAQDKPFGLARHWLASAREAIQFRKRRKLEKIMEFLSKKGKVGNRDVQLLLHISDATATRYLEQLEREGKIRQVGRTGQAVSYSKI